MEGLHELLIESDILIMYEYSFYKMLIKHVFFINRDLSKEPYHTIIKSFIPIFISTYDFENEKELLPLKVLIRELKEKPNEKELNNILIDNIIKYGLSANGIGYTINGHIYPLFKNKILKFESNCFCVYNRPCFFGNLFLDILIESGEDYNSLNDNLRLFNIDYVATVIKIRDIDIYFDKINWDFFKIKKQKLTFERILNNVHLFSIEDLNKIAITEFTYEQLQTLLLTKEILQ